MSVTKSQLIAIVLKFACIFQSLSTFFLYIVETRFKNEDHQNYLNFNFFVSYFQKSISNRLKPTIEYHVPIPLSDSIRWEDVISTLVDSTVNVKLVCEFNAVDFLTSVFCLFVNEPAVVEHEISIKESIQYHETLNL